MCLGDFLDEEENGKITWWIMELRKCYQSRRQLHFAVFFFVFSGISLEVFSPNGHRQIGHFDLGRFSDYF